MIVKSIGEAFKDYFFARDRARLGAEISEDAGDKPVPVLKR